MMKKATQFLMGALCLMLLGSMTALGQYTTVTVDGSIGADEYGSHTSGENTIGNWYMTWDASNLYVGITSSNVAEGAVLYLGVRTDHPINGGDDSDGTLVGFNYDGTSFAELPFRAKTVLYVKNGYREYRTSDGSNGWSASTSGFGSYTDNSGSATREFSIPWSEIGGIPSSFAFFGYVTSSGGYVYNQVPSANAGETIGTSARYGRYFIVESTADGSSMKPFSGDSYVFNSASDITDFGSISVYDFTMNTNGSSITRTGSGSNDWQINNDLVVNDGAIDFNSTSSTTSTDEIKVTGGALTLSGSGSTSTDIVSISSGTITTNSGLSINSDGLLYNTGGTFNGNTTINREITGNAGWRMLSLPIADGTVEDISDDTPVQGITDGDNAGEASNFYINTASDGTEGNGYAEPTNVSTAWGNGLGFIVYFYDNTTAGSSELPITLDASGSEPASDVTVALSDTYTLVGNPFASNFSLDELSGNDSGEGVNNGLVSPVNFWDDGEGTDASGSWVTQNFGSNNDNVASTWSGFFVQRNSSATTQLTIPTSGKTADDATAAHFSKEVANKAYREIELLLESPQGQSDRSNKLYFSEQSTEGIDAYDGGKFTPLNGSPYLAFVNEFGDRGELFVQDSRTLDPQEDQTYELALGDAGVSGTYKLSWPEFTNIPEGWSFTLKDYETGKTVKMLPGSSYEFSVEATQQQKVVSMLNLSAAKATRDEVTTRFSITLNKGTSTSNEPGDTPEGFTLEQNYPNPFNPTTSIQYSVGQAGPVSLSVYNVMGQKVAELVGETKTAGTYRVHWDAANMASGIYHYRLQSAGQVLTRQMTLIK